MINKKGIKTNRIRAYTLRLFAIGILLLYVAGIMQACHAQRHHHKAVPCPCEKKRR